MHIFIAYITYVYISAEKLQYLNYRNRASLTREVSWRERITLKLNYYSSVVAACSKYPLSFAQRIPTYLLHLKTRESWNSVIPLAHDGLSICITITLNNKSAVTVLLHFFFVFFTTSSYRNGYESLFFYFVNSCSKRFADFAPYTYIHTIHTESISNKIHEGVEVYHAHAKSFRDNCSRIIILCSNLWRTFFFSLSNPFAFT